MLIIKPAAAAPLVYRKAVTLVLAQRITVTNERSHHRNVLLRELERKLMLFEDRLG